LTQETLFLGGETKFKAGDRVKLLLYEDSDFYGTVEQVENKGDNSNNLVEDDDGFTSWYENKWLEKTDVQKGVNYGGCVLYPDGHIVDNFKDRFTKEDLAELEKKAKELEEKGFTGHSYSVICSCIRALKGSFGKSIIKIKVYTDGTWLVSSDESCIAIGSGAISGDRTLTLEEAIESMEGYLKEDGFAEFEQIVE
jgi:hypothetical protein